MIVFIDASMIQGGTVQGDNNSFRAREVNVGRALLVVRKEKIKANS